MGVNDPALFTGGNGIGMNFLMAMKTQCGKELIAAEPLAYAPRLVVDMVALFIFATLTAWVEGKIRFLCFAILLVFTLAFAGCIPQPSAALESLRSFKGSF
jgi:hypothetical protein